jgi:hypothetical protein
MPWPGKDHDELVHRGNAEVMLDIFECPVVLKTLLTKTIRVADLPHTEAYFKYLQSCHHRE